MRILIVEDEHKIANSIRKGLEQKSFAVDVAYDGIVGFDLAVGEKYDLIILDRLLPGMDWDYRLPMKSLQCITERLV